MIPETPRTDDWQRSDINHGEQILVAGDEDARSASHRGRENPTIIRVAHGHVRWFRRFCHNFLSPQKCEHVIDGAGAWFEAPFECGSSDTLAHEYKPVFVGDRGDLSIGSGLASAVGTERLPAVLVAAVLISWALGFLAEHLECFLEIGA